MAGDENQAARMAIFALDDQARYVDEAARRYGEAAAAGDNIPERAAKELAAEQALQNADATVGGPRRNPARDPDVPGRRRPASRSTHGRLPRRCIGPEETLDPFAGETDAAAAGDPAGHLDRSDGLHRPVRRVD